MDTRQRTANHRRFTTILRQYDLGTQELTDLLLMHDSHIRGMRSGCRPVTRRTLILLEHALANRPPKKSRAA